MTPFERLGAAVAEAAGSGPPSAARARVRQHVVSQGVPPRRAFRHSTLAFSLAAGLGAAVAGGVFFALEQRDVLSVQSAAGELREGAWVKADSQAPLQLEFESRGSVRLEPASRARLSRLSKRRVELSLETGSTYVDVRPMSGTGWVIAAGPFRVEVVGTAFSTAWDAENQRLQVTVQRGAVRVRGGSLDEEGMRVRAGESLVASAVEGKAVLSHAVAGKPLVSSTLPPTLPPTPLPELASSALPLASASVAPAPEQVPSVASDFRTLARNGKHAEALAQAEGAGFEQLTRTLGAADLALLADVARYQKQPGRARMALMALRQRHPTAPQTATATFLLGRMAAEQQRDYRTAASWFATYMSENRNGPMASEALGRQVQMLEQAGDRDQAREVASRYLQRFPKGSYAELARGLLAGESLKTAP